MGGQPISLLILAVLISTVVADDTCLSRGQLFGVIFGSVAAAFLISATLAMILYVWYRRSGTIRETDEKSAYANDACDVEDKGCDAPKSINKDKMTMIDSFKLKRKVEDAGTQKAYSMEFLNEVEGKVGVQLRGEDIGGLGFNIQGNMNEGIFVKEIISKGIAEQCGNILVGDKIKSLTINFENMVYEDAVTLLSYSSPYKVKLELERKLSDNASTSESDDEKEMRYHPLFRSNTLTHVHFNPLGTISTPTSVATTPQRCTSADSKQKHALPAKKEFVEPDSTTCADDSSQARDADNSRMDSSDYGSDGVSDCRESTASDGTQKTLSDRIEITDIIFDKVKSPTPPPARKLEQCTELPPKPRKMVSRSPSPIHKPPPSPKVNRSTSPKKMQQVEDSTQTTRLLAETKPTQTEKPKAPIPPPISSIPVRKEMETQTKTPSPVQTIVDRIVEIPPEEVAEDDTSKGPEITEARISRIPKRSDSIKTPVVERKLPALPKSVTQRSHSADKTRDVSSPPTAHTSGIPTPSRSNSTTTAPVVKTVSTDNEKYGTLTREKRDRLMANDAELERQREELKKLGVL
uniref:PDZ domain-containing protein n=1 Tax=Caenorhabditis tropicalis TaxID=1561998 RepID=A0A1I7T674_9PELO